MRVLMSSTSIDLEAAGEQEALRLQSVCVRCREVMPAAEWHLCRGRSHHPACLPCIVRTRAMCTACNVVGFVTNHAAARRAYGLADLEVSCPHCGAVDDVDVVARGGLHWRVCAARRRDTSL